MPDKQQGLFHALSCTLFHKPIRMPPEVQAPAPKTPERSQGDAQDQREALDTTDQSLQGSSSCSGTSALSRRLPPGAHFSLKNSVQRRCFFIVSGRLILPQATSRK